jgi:hypothetical protein
LDEVRSIQENAEMVDNLVKLKESLDEDLRKQIVSSQALLSRFCLIEESSRLSTQYQDPTYFPFYYYLGKYIDPKNVLEIGFDLGLASGSLFKSCKVTENFLAFQQDEGGFYSPHLGYRNLRLNYNKSFACYYGQVEDLVFQEKLAENKWQLVLFNVALPYDKYRVCLDLLWNHMDENGLLVLNKYSVLKEGITDFCKTKNRDSVIINTRYQTAIVQN